MIKSFSIITSIALIFLRGAETKQLSEESSASRILAVAQKMISAVKEADDIISETEIIYYKKGKEDKRYRLTYFYKQNGLSRLNFSRPYPGVTVFYKVGDKKLTVKPFRFLPLKFSFSIYNPMFKSPSGQRIDQADVEYIIKFLYKNIKWIQKRESELFEEENRIKFMFWARDYVENKNLEKYRVLVSKKNWLPVQIERYDFEDTPIETFVFKKYTINSHLKDEFLLP
ncbi:MAG: hypothetical protein JRJ02_13660 [Deltaproteobacteria bacterium]|nr:hypothetical protein [Deltaproteobacteria bacterium]